MVSQNEDLYVVDLLTPRGHQYVFLCDENWPSFIALSKHLLIMENDSDLDFNNAQDVARCLRRLREERGY